MEKLLENISKRVSVYVENEVDRRTYKLKSQRDTAIARFDGANKERENLRRQLEIAGSDKATQLSELKATVAELKTKLKTAGEAQGRAAKEIKEAKESEHNAMTQVIKLSTKRDAEQKEFNTGEADALNGKLAQPPTWERHDKYLPGYGFGVWQAAEDKRNADMQAETRAEVEKETDASA